MVALLALLTRLVICLVSMVANAYFFPRHQEQLHA